MDAASKSTSKAVVVTGLVVLASAVAVYVRMRWRSVAHQARPRRGSGVLATALQASAAHLDPHSLGHAVAHLPSASVPRITNIKYSHGGWMGASVSMLQAPVWRELFCGLTPASHARVHVALTAGKACSGSVMRLLENNPVVAAYGVAHELGETGVAGGDRDSGGLVSPRQPATPHVFPSGSVAHNPVVVEWDVYLDQTMCDQADTLLAAAAARSPSWGGKSFFASPPAGMRHAEDAAELDAVARDIARSTVISHGSLLHILLERVFGLSMHTSLLRESGGMTAGKWLEVYRAAIEAAAPHVRLEAPAGAPPRPLISVFLDVKSARTSAAALELLVRGLNGMGVHVWGIGSFVLRQLAAPLGGTPQIVTPVRERDLVVYDAEGGGEATGLLELGEDGTIASSSGSVRGSSSAGLPTPSSTAAGGGSASGAPLQLPPPIVFQIYSTPGEIQAGIAAGTIPRGTHILFNGGSLLLDPQTEPPPAATPALVAGAAGAAPTAREYPVDSRTLAALAASVASHDLHIGFYTQEHMLAPAAAAALIALADGHPAVFRHGFSYSNLRGVAAGDITRAGMTGFVVPWWLRRLVVKPWQHRGAAGSSGASGTAVTA
jgi:hypothetical protein